MTETLAKFLGMEQATAIERIDLSLAAPWAQENAFWVFLLVVLLVGGAVAFYLRLQTTRSTPLRLALGLARGCLLALLLLTLADPVVQLTLANRQRPTLYLVFDGTESMAIEDELPAGEREAIEKSLGLPAAPRDSSSVSTSEAARPSRTDYLQALLRQKENNLLTNLANDGQVQLEAFLFDGNTTSQLRKLNLAPPGSRRFDPEHLATQLTTRGQVTALGSVLREVSEQFGAAHPAGVVLFSDFAHNSGLAPLGSGPQSPLASLAAPIYAVGIGATESIDLAIDLQTDPKMKKAERTSLVVKLRQSGLDGRQASVRVTARKLSDTAAAGAPTEIEIGRRSLTLNNAAEILEFPFTPQDAGRIEFSAVAEKLEGEVVEQNNQVARQVNVIDDYLRLMYVAYEPTWEWRFIKEVFHRDKLVGMPGFRTFLSSSDPRVRQSNVLFLPTLTPKRSEFFANDVLLLDDMPRASLTDRFCEMTKEYVGTLGGGLVVIAGPRFGPRELYQTPLADMLPVILDPAAELRTAPEHPEFAPRLTAAAERYPFMQLGADAAENARAWKNLGQLPWYQPVTALHEQAIALAEHPTDKCFDGKTPQPLIAIRQYGKGEVVYLGFNETWRLRKQYGERYYRQFWSQLIYRLGMSHALGAEKRFIVRIDQEQYRVEDQVTLTIEAYDENYEPLTDENLPTKSLAAELTFVDSAGPHTTPVAVPLLRKGIFETRIPVFAAGAYSLRVKDPVTGAVATQRFEVAPLSVERRRGVRDDKLQHDLARQSRGKAYDLATVHQLPTDLKLQPVIERTIRNVPLWTTPLWFSLIVALMLGEWLTRKLVRLA